MREALLRLAYFWISALRYLDMIGKSTYHWVPMEKKDWDIEVFGKARCPRCIPKRRLFFYERNKQFYRKKPFLSIYVFLERTYFCTTQPHFTSNIRRIIFQKKTYSNWNLISTWKWGWFVKICNLRSSVIPILYTILPLNKWPLQS